VRSRCKHSIVPTGTLRFLFSSPVMNSRATFIPLARLFQIAENRIAFDTNGPYDLLS
jgi:hypothetical protein